MPLARLGRGVGVAGRLGGAAAAVELGREREPELLRDFELELGADFAARVPGRGLAGGGVLLHLPDLLVAHAGRGGGVGRAVDLPEGAVPGPGGVEVVDQDVVCPGGGFSIREGLCVCLEWRGEERGKADLEGAYQQCSLPPLPLSQSSLIFTPSPSLNLLGPWAHVGSVSLESQPGSPETTI